MVPDGHVMPQPPQFTLSVTVFAQYAVAPEPHVMSPPPHVVVHVPPLQTCPEAQPVPHAPQFELSVWRSRQMPEQLVRPAPQLTWHVPAEQIVPLGQTLPQLPQLSRSVDRS
jgi:hypothetical protein